MGDEKKDNLEDNHYLEIEQKFSINGGYESSYMDDTYKSEEYNAIKTLTEEIPKALDIFLESNPEYDEVRKIDVNKLRQGDEISCIHKFFNLDTNKDTNKDYSALILSINYPSLEIEVISETDFDDFNNGDIKEINVNQINPNNNIIFRLKQQDIALLYMGIKKLLPDGMISGNIEYFYVFTEYFKINEKSCYESLSAKDKFDLNEELEERTGIPSSRGIMSLKW